MLFLCILPLLNNILNSRPISGAGAVNNAVHRLLVVVHLSIGKRPRDILRDLCMSRGRLPLDRGTITFKR